MRVPAMDKPRLVRTPVNCVFVVSIIWFQEYFSDGMTDDITTDLSKISGLFVIAHISTFNLSEQVPI